MGNECSSTFVGVSLVVGGDWVEEKQVWVAGACIIKVLIMSGSNPAIFIKSGQPTPTPTYPPSEIRLS